jgi:RNA polymerase sigma-70 factor (ECF subfamily)
VTRPPADDERHLAAAITAGDERALESLFRAHYGALCSFVHGLVASRETAEELVQTVFLNVWTKREALDVRESMRAYLFGAARNLAINHLERARLERRWAQGAGAAGDAAAADAALMSSPAPGPDVALESSETARVVQRAIAGLSERAQLAVRLRWEHQLSYAEIAEVMGISVKGVEVQLARAREVLRGVLEGEMM